MDQFSYIFIRQKSFIIHSKFYIESFETSRLREARKLSHKLLKELLSRYNHRMQSSQYCGKHPATRNSLKIGHKLLKPERDGQMLYKKYLK